MRHKHKVWDKINGDEDSSMVIEAFHDHESYMSAETYAEEDIDGNIDGIYDKGHPIMVRNEEGYLYEYEVFMEPEPRFYALLKKDKL